MQIDEDLIDRSLDALEDVFYVYDETGRLVYWNRRLNELFGLEDDELDGMTPPEFFVDTDKPAVERAVGELFETGETVVEARAETTEGQVRFQLTGQRLTGAGGDVVGFSGVARDVTETHERERRLARQNERLDEFVSVVSHDLQNPLTVLDGALALAAETGDREEFERCRRAIDRMDELIEDLLTLARKGEWVEGLTPIELGAVAERCWADLDTGDATLHVGTDRTVLADESRLAQLLENLYLNAVEHGTAGPPERNPPTVTVDATEDGFVVADDGPGIPEGERGRVFETGYSSTASGTGLGLNIVEQIAKAHGWTVDVTEATGGGARFDIGGVEPA